MRNRFLPVLLGLAVSAGHAFGCASCFGQSDSQLAKGLNGGIFVLLGFVACFWAMFGSFFIFIARRARQVNGPLPGDQHDPIHS